MNVKKNKFFKNKNHWIICLILPFCFLITIPFINSCSYARYIDFKKTTKIFNKTILVNELPPVEKTVQDFFNTLPKWKKIIAKSSFIMDADNASKIIDENNLSIPITEIENFDELNNSISMNVYLNKYYYEGIIYTKPNTTFINNKNEITQFLTQQEFEKLKTFNNLEIEEYIYKLSRNQNIINSFPSTLQRGDFEFVSRSDKQDKISVLFKLNRNFTPSVYDSSVDLIINFAIKNENHQQNVINFSNSILYGNPIVGENYLPNAKVTLIFNKPTQNT